MASYASASDFMNDPGDPANPQPVATPRSSFAPSPQQQAVFDFVSSATDADSAFVEAVAGSGKTTTLVEACKRMKGSNIAFAAYNRKIGEEIKSRLERLGLGWSQGVRAGTFHSFGFSAWRRACPKVTVDDRAKKDAMMAACRVPFNLESAVGKLVSFAKQTAVSLAWQSSDVAVWNGLIDHHDLAMDLDPINEETERERLIELASAGVEWSKSQGSTLIDFDDMIWLPLVTKDVRIYTNDWVLVDEAQDTNPVRRLMAERMMYPGSGKSLWVGDRNQAIYGFTGADADAIDRIIARFDATSLPLTVTYRCPKSIVQFAQRYVSHITAHESAIDGAVTDVGRDVFVKDWMPKLVPGDAILCRNTRPLVSLAFRLIRAGIGCHVEGRDIGQGLLKLATRWKVKTVDALTKMLDAHREKEAERLTRTMKRNADYAIEALNDRIDTLLVVMEGCATVDEVAAKIDRMFKNTMDGQRNTVTLSTIHKAKGREWPRVFILGFSRYMPSKYARQPWQKQQETNLAYVAATRAQRELVLTAAIDD